MPDQQRESKSAGASTSEPVSSGGPGRPQNGSTQLSASAAPPSGCKTISLLGVDYFRLKTSDGGDLYLTRFGWPFREHLQPENWHAREWFEAKRERLEGTGTVYRVPTRLVNGTSLHLVVKWSRVGEVVPLDTLTVTKFIQAEFNSPFEEFSLLMELRRGEAGPSATDCYGGGSGSSSRSWTRRSSRRSNAPCGRRPSSSSSRPPRTRS